MGGMELPPSPRSKACISPDVANGRSRAESGQQRRPVRGSQHVVTIGDPGNLREHHDLPVIFAPRATHDQIGPSDFVLLAAPDRVLKQGRYREPTGQSFIAHGGGSTYSGSSGAPITPLSRHVSR